MDGADGAATGQVTEVVGNEVRTRPIEASSVILARYNLPSFKAEVLRRAGLPPADSGNSESKLVSTRSGKSGAIGRIAY